ncbi:hypothetical protein [Nocardia sp. NPDC050710]|uniref:hypothetical protein n=1 Tax=Nocardia sp. NPDC050710 TaxID=3157220 RepID=UPI0033C51EC2
MAVRLALVGIPRLLADLIGSAFTEADDVVVERFDEEAAAGRGEFGACRHDVLIAGVDDPWDDGLRAEFGRIDAVVLGMRPDGRVTWIYEMRPCPRALGALDPRQLRRVVLDSMRSAGPPAGGE